MNTPTSLLSKLFGGAKAPAKPASIEHEGDTITPRPMPEGSQFRLSALIEKAKLVIDQQGDRLF